MQWYVVFTAIRQNIEVISLDIRPSGFEMVSDGYGIVNFSEGLKVFGSLAMIMKPSFNFTNVKFIEIPAICSVYNSGLL